MFGFSLYHRIVELVEEIHDLSLEIRSLKKLIRLRTPGLVYLEVLSEEDGMLKFKVVLPAPGASDVEKRELSVKIGDADPTTVTLPGSALESDVLECEDSTGVSGTLIDIDNAGNRSEPRTFESVVEDTIAPPQPGEIGVQVVAET